MANRGKKDCPNCNTEIGARCLLCSNCGYHFPSKEIRKDLLEKKSKFKEMKTYTSTGQGRKVCPGCNTIIGAVTKICFKCQFDFSSVVKEEKPKKVKKEAKEEKVLSEEQKQLIAVLSRSYVDVEIPKLTPKEHAKRILNYGAERAKILLFIAKTRKCWSHADWDMVEQKV